MMRNFIRALRQSESRAGNSAPIRFFGCLEFGGTFGRPHYHMLLYNVVKNYQIPPLYTRGLPRPVQYTSLWPHGSYDPAEFNKATLNYVAEYMMKHSDTPPIPFRTTRPAIGFYGIQRLADVLARRHGTLPERPTYFSVGQRKFPLDQWTKDTFDKLFLGAGGKYAVTKNAVVKARERLAFQQALAAMPDSFHLQEARKVMRLEKIQHAKKVQQELKEQAITEIFFDRTEAPDVSDFV
jgi:hypothetical protein